ncbi:MAG: nuclear transport factor 2 family protein [Puia sp.]|nr:nuclear transport factor 2 family protein [Puia sp.]
MHSSSPEDSARSGAVSISASEVLAGTLFQSEAISPPQLNLPLDTRRATHEFFRKLTVDWMEAWKARDLPALDELLAEEFCYVSRRVKSMCVGKMEWLRMAVELYSLEDYEIDFLATRIHEYAAVVVYRLCLFVKPNHSDASEKYVVTDNWALNSHPGGPRWQTVSRQLLQL